MERVGHKIHDTLWAYRTSFQTPMGVSPFRYLYGYVCHLPTDLKQLCYWTTKVLNSDCMNGRESLLLKFKESENWRNRVEEKKPHMSELMAYADQRWLNMEFFEVG